MAGHKEPKERLWMMFGFYGQDVACKYVVRAKVRTTKRSLGMAV
jgi:hypothetical protein